MAKPLLTPSFWSPAAARTSAGASNRTETLHDWNWSVLTWPHSCGDPCSSVIITKELERKMLLTPAFFTPVTAARLAVVTRRNTFTDPTASSSSAASCYATSPKLLTPAVLSTATESTRAGCSSPTATATMSSGSSASFSPTTSCQPRRAKLLLIPAFPTAPGTTPSPETLTKHKRTISTPSSIAPSLPANYPTPKLLTPAFVSAPTHRRRRLPVFRTITSRFE
ncbi:hypothetical protein JG687_00005408 [Phytophthora cactorum]|uniref:Uncharacterized protein n=1 Tax=Phytophthora cactorum TaxID=29920 RepID=A0A329S7A8_9STRA|nr:hypothetical protein PC112_g7738 [Phytophthora cactorum]KAG2903256.1 hypothetical protein PC114_g12347 [Phytophthora cactorum]KAG2936558.1 hypothetical protein PC117_g12005 [Phytophthora cactorum]KAG3017638.1 hypothetical protein PC120_g10909 [Phytophthora cactorum]KAG3183709.1 hypothetical protein PC128_g14039 [Phytophthora cactorum]